MVDDDILQEVRIRLYGKEEARTQAEHTAVCEHWAGAFDEARQTEAHFIQEALKLGEE